MHLTIIQLCMLIQKRAACYEKHIILKHTQPFGVISGLRVFLLYICKFFLVHMLQ